MTTFEVGMTVLNKDGEEDTLSFRVVAPDYVEPAKIVQAEFIFDGVKILTVSEKKVADREVARGATQTGGKLRLLKSAPAAPSLKLHSSDEKFTITKDGIGEIKPGDLGI